MMSLKQAIAHGKERRSPHRQCRCAWCRDRRAFPQRQQAAGVRIEQQEAGMNVPYGCEDAYYEALLDGSARCPERPPPPPTPVNSTETVVAGIVWCDGESWCLDVAQDVFQAVTGDAPSVRQESYSHPGYYRLYPAQLVRVPYGTRVCLVVRVYELGEGE